MDVNIEQLDRMRLDELRSFWQKNIESVIPPVRSAEVLRWTIAWRLQADAYGGLRTKTQRRLRELANTPKGGDDRLPHAVPDLKPGTTLTREWQGAKHSVQVLEEGFAYRGKRYPTLSSVARAITRTRWSGPVFFGLKKPKHRAGADS